MALLVPITVGPNGVGKIGDLVASLAPANGGGDSFRVQGKEVLVISNADVASKVVTVHATKNNFGIDTSQNYLLMEVPAGGVGIIGPLEAGLFADADGLAQIEYSAVTSVTVGLKTFATTS